MKRSKVDRILGERSMPEGSKGAIDIHVHASGLPSFPWAAAAEGLTVYAGTVHEALDRLLESLARQDRAEVQG